MIARIVVQALGVFLLGVMALPGVGADFSSKYGEGDEIGAANLLSDRLTLDAIGLIEQGRVYSLGIAVSSETPAFPPRSASVTVLTPGQGGGKTFGSNHGSYTDDIFHGWLGIGTQIDGLGHLGANATFYNNYKAADIVQPDGLRKLGVEKIPPIATRGIMLDIAALKGKERMEAGEVITPDDIQKALEADNLEIQEGDVVLLHTGWMSLLGEDNEQFGKGEPGINQKAAKWLADQKVVAVGADNWGLEAVPHENPDEFFPAHVELLANNGVYILENINTAELVRDDVNEFFFVLGQAKVKGAVQMIVNPLAIR